MDNNLSYKRNIFIFLKLAFLGVSLALALRLYSF